MITANSYCKYHLQYLYTYAPLDWFDFECVLHCILRCR